MKLLIEQVPEFEIITEGRGSDKKVYIEGVFLQCIPNRNGRIYPENVMHTEVNRYIKEMVETNRAVGELGHPTNPSINPDRISHKIESLTIDGKNIYGKARIAENDVGDNVRGLLATGIQLGVSSRGLGTLKEQTTGLKEVQNDFRLITAADIVMDPSAPDAFVQGIMENVEWFYNSRTGSYEKAELAESIRKEVKHMSKRQIQENALRLLENFLKTQP